MILAVVDPFQSFFPFLGISFRDRKPSLDGDFSGVSWRIPLLGGLEFDGEMGSRAGRSYRRSRKDFSWARDSRIAWPSLSSGFWLGGGMDSGLR